MSELPAVIPEENIPNKNPENSEDIDVLDVVESSRAYLSLSPEARMILKQYVDDFITETIHTDSEIARIVGCHVNTVYRAKRNVLFQQAINTILPEVGRVNNLDILLQVKNWVEKDWRAGEYYHKVTRAYIPRSQQAILTARVDGGVNFNAIRSPQAAIRAVVSQFGGLGYTKQRLIDEIGNAWDQARQEGLF